MSKGGHLAVQRQEVGRSSDDQSPDVLVSIIVTDKMSMLNMASLTAHSLSKEESCQDCNHKLLMRSLSNERVSANPSFLALFILSPLLKHKPDSRTEGCIWQDSHQLRIIKYASHVFQYSLIKYFREVISESIWTGSSARWQSAVPLSVLFWNILPLW